MPPFLSLIGNSLVLKELLLGFPPILGLDLPFLGFDMTQWFVSLGMNSLICLDVEYEEETFQPYCSFSVGGRRKEAGGQTSK